MIRDLVLPCAHPFEGPPAPLECPGIRATVDGSAMVAWVETRISEVACAYPITSSQTMGQAFQAEVAAGKRNLWGQPLTFIEPGRNTAPNPPAKAPPSRARASRTSRPDRDSS